MNFLTRSLMTAAKTCLGSAVDGTKFSISRSGYVGLDVGNILKFTGAYIGNTLQGLQQMRTTTSLRRMLRLNRPYKKPIEKKRPLDGNPFAKGVILKTLTKKPKKPNSANRKCVQVRLSTGKEAIAYVPGEGHNLQEHQIVLCRVGRLRDVPGVKLKCVRGKYDLPHVVKTKK